MTAPDALAILRRYIDMREHYPHGALHMSLAEMKTVLSALEARDAQIKAMAGALKPFIGILEWFERLQELDRDVRLRAIHADGPGSGGSHGLEVKWFRGARAALTPDIAALVERAKLVSAVLEQVELWTMAAGPGIDDQLLAAWETLAAHDAKAAEGGGT